jgi:hypothetical protein
MPTSSWRAVMRWRITYWWRYGRPTLYQRCFDCHRLETILGWRIGTHTDCLPF